MTSLVLFFSTPVQAAQVTSSLWQTDKSQHFIIYYQEATPQFVREVRDRAEDYYNGIVDELGYTRFNFWSWDNRSKIYLYNNAADFQKETKYSAWAGAVVSVNSRVISSYIGQNFFLDSILPHEMTHIIFREFIGMNIPLPLWIDEGVACSQEKSNLNSRMRTARQLIAQNKYLSLEQLCRISKPDEKDVTPEVFYSEAASIIVFLIRDNGREGFLDFSRLLRDGTNWRKALLKAFRFSSLEELEESWKNFMMKQ